MKSFVVGYADEKGAGPATLLYGSEHGVSNNALEFADIKHGGKYPGDIVRVEYWVGEPKIIGIKLKQAAPTEPKPSQPKGKVTMKKIIGLIALFALTLGLTTASAQSYVNGTYTTGCSVIWPNAGATNVTAYSGTLDIRKAKYVTISVYANNSAAGTNMLYNFMPSVDGSNWQTNQLSVFTVQVPNGTGATGPTIYTTNFLTGGVGYLKLISVGPNYDADAIYTNIWVKYSYLID